MAVETIYVDLAYSNPRTYLWADSQTTVSQETHDEETLMQQNPSDGYKSQLYDSDTGQSCTVEKVIAITQDCPKLLPGEQCILLYTRTKRGRIVEISLTYSEQKPTSPHAHIHFFIDELTEMINNIGNDPFCRWSERLGLSNPTFIKLIKTHAPAA